MFFYEYKLRLSIIRYVDISTIRRLGILEHINWKDS